MGSVVRTLWHVVRLGPLGSAEGKFTKECKKCAERAQRARRAQMSGQQLQTTRLQTIGCGSSQFRQEPKDWKNCKVALRGWIFQARLKISSEPPTKPQFCGEFWRSRLKCFKRDWEFQARLTFFSLWAPTLCATKIRHFLTIAFCKLIRDWRFLSAMKMGKDECHSEELQKAMPVSEERMQERSQIRGQFSLSLFRSLSVLDDSAPATCCHPSFYPRLSLFSPSCLSNLPWLLNGNLLD